MSTECVWFPGLLGGNGGGTGRWPGTCRPRASVRLLQGLRSRPVDHLLPGRPVHAARAGVERASGKHRLPSEMFLDPVGCLKLYSWS